MRKFLAALFSVLVCGIVVMCAACKNDDEAKKPEKIKDGIALVLTEGESCNVDLSEYISIEGTDFVYEVSSSDEAVATATVEGNTATVSAVSEGSATVTASADEVSVTFDVTVNGEQQQPVEKPAPEFNDVNISYDLKDVDSKSVTITPKSGASSFNYTFALKEEDDKVAITGNRLTVSYEEAVEKQLVIVATYTDSANSDMGEKTVEFNLNIKVTDTREKPGATDIFKVTNGSFDNDLEGWTMVGNMGAISEQGTFWEGLPIFNEGKYFAGDDAGTGTLTSSDFVVGGINKITFKLGAAGNRDCYITLEKSDGTVLAIWRNTKFKDVGDWIYEEIGKTQFACNLVTYVADLSAYEGETLKIVLHDNATSNFGFINFDELVTYYAAEADLPSDTVAVTNELADKTALKALVDGALTAQGDYTTESFNAYTQKVEAAQAVLDKFSATQEEVDEAETALKSAYEALEVRSPAEKEDAGKSFHMLAGTNKVLTISEYIDDNGLSGLLTYEVEAGAGVSVSEITDGKFTVTAGSEEAENATVTIVAKYDEKTVLTVEISIAVITETAPLLKKEAVEEDVDLFDADDKESITLDFAENVENIGELQLTYTVTLNEETLTLDGTSYTYTFGSYTETATAVVFAVKVEYTHNGTPAEISYNYTLNIKDTRAYRLTNGGFDEGLEGWTLINNDLGGVNGNQTYWDGIPFNNDGNFFNAYYFNGEAKESATGTLTSSSFVIGGSGWITYKLGGAKNADKVFLDIIEKDTGKILARYYNNAFSDDTANTQVRGCTLVAYKANLSEFKGKTVYIRISDNGVTDYGLFFVDSFVTYCPEAPANDLTEAAEVSHPDSIYEIYNGGFESGLAGWTLSGGEIGAVTSDNGYWNGGNPEDTANEYGKEGDKLFSWWSWDSAANDGAGAEVNREGNMGTLTSNMFVLQAGKYVAFKFGGGANNRNVFIELVNAESGSVIAVFRNDNAEGGKLKNYSYQVDGLTKDTLCYFRIVDNAVVGWGCVAADDFRVNLDSAPEGSAAAENHKSDYSSVVNGSFESGLDGWTMAGNLGAVVNEERGESWYQTNEATKEGDYLFTFHYNNGEEYVNVEGETGIVRSSAFILEKNGIISFRFGAAHNSEVYINVYTTGGKLLATFRNNAYEQDTVMVHYYYQFDNSEEISCYFEVVDNATRDYGCIVMDDFRVNLQSVPEGAVLGSDRVK